MLGWIITIALGVCLGGLLLAYWRVVLSVLWLGLMTILTLGGAVLVYGWLHTAS